MNINVAMVTSKILIEICTREHSNREIRTEFERELGWIALAAKK